MRSSLIQVVFAVKPIKQAVGRQKKVPKVTAPGGCTAAERIAASVVALTSGRLICALVSEVMQLREHQRQRPDSEQPAAEEPAAEEPAAPKSAAESATQEPSGSPAEGLQPRPPSRLADSFDDALQRYLVQL
jgi:hypothetical protein